MATSPEQEKSIVSWALQNPEQFYALGDRLGTHLFKSEPWATLWPPLYKAWQDHGSFPSVDDVGRLIAKLKAEPMQRMSYAHELTKAYTTTTSDYTYNDVRSWIAAKEFTLLGTRMQETDLSKFDLASQLQFYEDRLRAIKTLTGERSIGEISYPLENLENWWEDVEEDFGAPPTTTGLYRLNRKLRDNGVRPTLVLLVGPSGGGKAQPLDAKILTPSGWSTMGEMHVGKRICNTFGGEAVVTGVFPQGRKKVYWVHFSDGSETYCCGDHLWAVNTSDRKHAGLPDKVLTTEQIRNDLTYAGAEGGKKSKWQVPVAFVEFDSQEVPLDPYLLGLLLGNAGMTCSTVRFSSGDKELVDAVDKLLPPGVDLAPVVGDPISWYLTGGVKGKKNPLTRTLRLLGLHGHKTAGKFIPECYKFNTAEVRLAVLQGLLDTDGFVENGKTRVELCTASMQLSLDVEFLVRSLGGISTHVKPKVVNGVSYQRMSLKLPKELAPFRLERKKARYKPPTKYHPARVIRDIKCVYTAPCQCISTSASDHCYITDDFIVTHNTTLLKHIEVANIRDGGRWVSCIMDDNPGEMKQRYCQNIGRRYLTSDDYSPEKRERLGKALQVEVRKNYPGKLIQVSIQPDKYGPQDFLRFLTELQRKLKMEDEQVLKRGGTLPWGEPGRISGVGIDTGNQIATSKAHSNNVWYGTEKMVSEASHIPKAIKAPLYLAIQGNQESVGAAQITSRNIGVSFGMVRPAKLVLGLAQTFQQSQTAKTIDWREDCWQKNKDNLWNVNFDTDKDILWEPASLCIIKNTMGSGSRDAGTTKNVIVPLLVSFATSRIIEDYSMVDQLMRSPRQTAAEEKEAWGDKEAPPPGEKKSNKRSAK